MRRRIVHHVDQIPVGYRSLFVGEDADEVGFGERSARQVHEDLPVGDHHVDVVAVGFTFSAFVEFVERDVGLRRDDRGDRFAGSLGDERSVNAKVIFQELDVALEGPIDLGGGTQAVIEAEVARVSFSGRAAPHAVLVSAVAVRISFME